MHCGRLLAGAPQGMHKQNVQAVLQQLSAIQGGEVTRSRGSHKQPSVFAAVLIAVF